MHTIPFRANRGGVEVAIILAAVAFSVMLAGGFFAANQTPQSPPICCDSGDGANCRVNPTKKVTYMRTEYDLLKSNVTISDTGGRLKDSGQKTPAPNLYPIIINVSNFDTSNCGGGSKDQLADDRSGTPQCQAIPKAAIIYVCKSNCHPQPGSSGGNPDNYHYGDGTTIYDIYFSTADIDKSTGTPNLDTDVVINCHGAINPADDSGLATVNQSQRDWSETVTISPFPQKSTLTMHTLTPGIKVTQWLRPF